MDRTEARGSARRPPTRPRAALFLRSAPPGRPLIVVLDPRGEPRGPPADPSALPLKRLEPPCRRRPPPAQAVSIPTDLAISFTLAGSKSTNFAQHWIGVTTPPSDWDTSEAHVCQSLPTDAEATSALSRPGVHKSSFSDGGGSTGAGCRGLRRRSGGTAALTAPTASRCSTA